MRNFKKEKREIEDEVFVSITCDVCGKEYTDEMEIQEFTLIEYRAGYGSVFGDDSQIECDVCQHCLKEKLGQYIRVKPSELSNIPF